MSEAGAAIHDGLRRGGVDLVVYLPESVLEDATDQIEADPEITTLVCSREDEGVAIAAGAALTGRMAAVLMEGSGLGLSGLILARALLHHVPLLVIASHNRVLGESMAFHAATNLAAEATFTGLGIPHLLVTDRDALGTWVEQAIATARGQRTVIGLLVPPFVMRDA